MSNQAEIDYEKQFQEDLAKATALSLEQQALDEYRRTKKYGAAYAERAQSLQQDATNRYYAQLRRQHYGRGHSTDTASSAPPAPLNLHRSTSSTVTRAQRRHSEVTNAASDSAIVTSGERSRTPPSANLPENDLISFASPTTKKSENTSFEKLIEDLQKMQATNPQTALVPLGPTAAAPMHSQQYRSAPHSGMYAGVVTSSSRYASGTGTAGMQLVPFIPAAQQERVPLTNEQLQKLYSMPHPQKAAVYAPHHHVGFVASTGGTYPQSAPVIGTSGAAPYSVPVQYPNTYGFQYNTVPSAAVGSQLSYQSTMPASTTAAANAFKSQMHNVGSADISKNISSGTTTSQIPKAHSTTASAVGSVSNGSGVTSNSNAIRRPTPPARRSRIEGEDLIDLSQEDDSRVSVLEAFDPLLNDDDGVWKK